MVFLFTKMIDMYSGPERRKYKRVKVKFPVVYRITEPPYVQKIIGADEFVAQTVDLSEGGAAILVDHYLPIKTKFLLKFNRTKSNGTISETEDELIIVTGTVTSVVPVDHYHYRLGVSFGLVNEEMEAKFFDLLCLPY